MVSGRRMVELYLTRFGRGLTEWALDIVGREGVVANERAVALGFTRKPPATMPRIATVVALGLPILLTAWFVHLYSTAMPLTDEWLFLRSSIALETVDPTSWNGLGHILRVIPYRIYQHHVLVPFLVYWPLAELSNFDNRALIVVILTIWGVMLLVFRLYIVRSTLFMVPIAWVLFSPARYVELLWGFEFTLALSVLLPSLGLVVLSRIGPDEGGWKRTVKATAAAALIIAGTLSSAGGFFGFVGAAAVLIVRRLPLQKTLVLLGWLIAVTAAVYLLFMRDVGRTPFVNLRSILFILSAFGATILGIPVSVKTFSVNTLSLTGAGLVLVMIGAIMIALRRRILSSLALPVGLFVFSLSAVAAISIARRDALANWHLQYALPGVCSAYAAAYLVCREVPSREAIESLVAAAALLLLAPVADFHAFYQYGPSYNAYIHSIERYARTYLANPAQKKPFPETGGWDLNANMVWFLAARNHPTFAAENKTFLKAARTAVSGGRVDLASTGIPGGDRSHLRVVATLPPNTIADAVIVKISSMEVVLRKTDERLVAPVMCGNECFSGWILAGTLPPGSHAVQLSTVRLELGGG